MSGGSIIGSGWLFGAQEALITAGPAARCGGTSASSRHFSLVIYFWAMRVALTLDRIEEMIGDVVLPEADPGVA